MLSLQNYSKSYNNRVILSLSERIFDEGIHLIQGTNGSGKTTLFKSIAGIVRFNGDCYIDGVSLKKDPVSYRRWVNYCEAEPQFPGFLTGEELISFVTKTKGGGDTKIITLVETFGIDHYWKMPVSTYSSGMLKKIALIMAFCGTPKLILLDEPFTTIDQGSLIQLSNLIEDYKYAGCSFIMSAHQMKETIPINIDSILSIQDQTLRPDK